MRDTQRKRFYGKVVKSNVVWGDTDVWNLLFLDDNDHQIGVQPLQQPGEEQDQGPPQEVIIGQSGNIKCCLG